jgi:3-phenylpropionate/trans-cinnamate dioxygenase ferredoxin reductase component
MTEGHPPERVVVVGASLAGLRTAQALRSGGYEGALTLVGDEEHEPYDRPPLSKQVLAGEWDVDRIALREPGGYDALGIDLRLGRRAVDLDVAGRTVELHGGERLAWDALVVATGARPRVLPGTPDLDGIHLLRTLDDSLALRRALEDGPRVVVVGAGFIGAEVAAVARTRGLDVTVLEALPVPLSRGLGPEMGAACAAVHLDHGVDLRCGVGVAGFEGHDRVEAVRLSDGAAVAADVVVVGVGVSPTTGWLEASGLELRDGVVCDQACRAVDASGVWAAGDVARWPNALFGEEMRVEHWTNAAEQGGAVAANLLAAPDAVQPFAPVPFVWSDQYDAKIQIVGRGRAGDEVRVVHGAVADRRFVALYRRDDRLVGAIGFNMPKLLMGYRRLLRAPCSWADALAHASDVS